MHPGQRNSLDALAKRYEIDNSERELHGALLDARILAEVYLAMTGGQASLSLDAAGVEEGRAHTRQIVRIERVGLVLPVLLASPTELAAHEAIMAKIRGVAA
jgi:DNA polymerase-3 subunit epsilon